VNASVALRSPILCRQVYSDPQWRIRGRGWGGGHIFFRPYLPSGDGEANTSRELAASPHAHKKYCYNIFRAHAARPNKRSSNSVCSTAASTTEKPGFANGDPTRRDPIVSRVVWGRCKLVSRQSGTVGLILNTSIEMHRVSITRSVGYCV
jgi:hypothetical protein